MKINLNFFSLLGLGMIMAALFTSCEKEDETIADAEFTIEVVNNSGFGKILVNQDNQSIYFFAGDVSGESTCIDGCADVWPAVTGDLYELKLGADLYKDDFGSITLEYGEKQLTYKGWPLYYFSPEGDGVLESPGATEGDGRGGLFHIAKPDYDVLLAKQVVEEGGNAIVYLVNDRGVSLYLNNGDEENVSNCNGGCAGVWPPFQSIEYLVVPSSLKLNDFDSLEREDDLGPQQSYKGSPMYFFSQDEEKRASVLGQGGGPNQTFFVVVADID